MLPGHRSNVSDIEWMPTHDRVVTVGTDGTAILHADDLPFEDAVLVEAIRGSLPEAPTAAPLAIP